MLSAARRSASAIRRSFSARRWSTVPAARRGELFAVAGQLGLELLTGGALVAELDLRTAEVVLEALEVALEPDDEPLVIDDVVDVERQREARGALAEQLPAGPV